MPKVLILNNTISQSNWGAQATPIALQLMLEDHIPNVEIAHVEQSPLLRNDRVLDIPFLPKHKFDLRRRGYTGALLRRHSTTDPGFPEIWDDFEYFGNRWMGDSPPPAAKYFLPILSQADVVALNAENGIYRNTPVGVRGLFLLWLSKAFLNKYIAVLNQTALVVQADFPTMRGIVKNVYELVDKNTVREPESFRNLKELGIVNIELVPDPVFYMRPSDSAQARIDAWLKKSGLHEKSFFLFSASALPMSKPRAGWPGSVQELVKKLRTHFGVGVVIAKEQYLQWLRQVAEQTDCHYFGPEHTFWELIALIRRASVAVTGHYHNTIFSTMVGTPFIPLTTANHKMQGVKELIGWGESPIFEATSLQSSIDQIVDVAGRIAVSPGRRSEFLLERGDELRKQSARNAEVISELLSGNVGKLSYGVRQ